MLMDSVFFFVLMFFACNKPSEIGIVRLSMAPLTLQIYIIKMHPSSCEHTRADKTKFHHSFMSHKHKCNAMQNATHAHRERYVYIKQLKSKELSRLQHSPHFAVVALPKIQLSHTIYLVFCYLRWFWNWKSCMAFDFCNHVKSDGFWLVNKTKMQINDAASRAQCNCVLSFDTTTLSIVHRFTVAADIWINVYMSNHVGFDTD